MREIKFRAWEKNRKEIIPVYNIDFEKKIINTESAWRLFDEIELMQYTGLSDKNGKDIYEGDIVHIKHFYKDREHIGEVFYDYNRFAVMNFYFPHFDNPNDAFEMGSDLFEVIGNIYETPHLVEGK